MKKISKFCFKQYIKREKYTKYQQDPVSSNFGLLLLSFLSIVFFLHLIAINSHQIKIVKILAILQFIALYGKMKNDVRFMNVLNSIEEN